MENCGLSIGNPCIKRPFSIRMHSALPDSAREGGRVSSRHDNRDAELSFSSHGVCSTWLGRAQREGPTFGGFLIGFSAHALRGALISVSVVPGVSFRGTAGVRHERFCESALIAASFLSLVFSKREIKTRAGMTRHW